MLLKPETERFCYLAASPLAILLPAWILISLRGSSEERLRLAMVVFGAPILLAKVVLSSPGFIDNGTIIFMGACCFGLLLLVVVFFVIGIVRKDATLVLTSVFVYGCTAIVSLFFLFIVRIGAGGV